MAKQGIVTNGEVAFSNLTEFDSYKGKSTGNYTLTITIPDSEAQRLEDMGVRIKTYEDKEGNVKLQRKFKSQFNVKVMDLEDHPIPGELPYGSKVRVLWTAGEMNPDYGLGTYMQAVRVVELNEPDMAVPDEF